MNETGFYKVENSIVEYNLSHIAFRVYHTLVMYSYNKTKRVEHSVSFLCEVSCMHKNSWTKGVKELEDKGLISVTKIETKGSRWDMLSYKVHVPRHIKPDGPVTSIKTEQKSPVTLNVMENGSPVTSNVMENGSPVTSNVMENGSPVTSNVITYNNKTYNNKTYNNKNTKKGKPTLFDIPKPKTEEEIFREKVEQYIKNRTMLGLNDFKKYYNLVHKEIFGTEPGGSPMNDTAKQAVTILTKELGISEEIILLALPHFFTSFKVHGKFNRLSFNMIVNQHKEKVLRDAAKISVTLGEKAYKRRYPNKKEDYTDLVF